MQTPFPILYEDNHLLVVSKPAGLATMGAESDKQTLVELAKDYLAHKYNKPGNVYLGVVSRLDAFVTGAIVLARTSKAASRLTAQFQSRSVQKTYWAVLEDVIEPSQGELVDHVYKDDKRKRMVTAARPTSSSKEARLSYETLETCNIGAGRIGALVQVQLDTGRKHQIRLQFSDRDCPVLGDRKYGGKLSFPKGIALHSRYLEFEHPVRKEALSFSADLPKSWLHLGLRSAHA